MEALLSVMENLALTTLVVQFRNGSLDELNDNSVPL